MFRVKLPVVSDLETGTHIWTFFHTPSLAVSVYRIGGSTMPDRWACAIIDLNDPSRLAEWMVFDAHAAGAWVLANGKERFFALPGLDPDGRRPEWFHRVLPGSLVPVQEGRLNKEVGFSNSGGHPVLWHRRTGGIDCAFPSQIVVKGETCETVAALDEKEQAWIRIRRDEIEQWVVVNNATHFRLAPNLAVFSTAAGNTIVWSNNQFSISGFFMDVSVNGENILFLSYSNDEWFWEWWWRSRRFPDELILESRYHAKHVEKFDPLSWHYPRLSPDLRWLIVPKHGEVLIFDVKED